MNKAIEIMATSLLLVSLSMSRSCIVANARDSITDTQKPTQILTYDDFCKLYTCHEDVREVSDKIIEVDQEDAVRLMKLSQAEAGEVDPLSIAYVMKVVINRVNDDAFPDTVDEVIRQKTNGRYAFSVMRGKYDKTVPNVNAHYALYLLESGQIETDAEYFEAAYVKNSWQSRNLEFLFEYGGHRFYK